MKNLLFLLFLMVLGTSAYAQDHYITENGYVFGRYWSSDRFKSVEGVLYVEGYPNLVLAKFPQNKNIAIYTVLDETGIIAKGAFQGNKYIQTIRIPSSVKYIGDNAFDGCENLSSIEVYESSSTNDVNEVYFDTDSEATEVGRYNIQGVKIQDGEDGQVQIILFTDGKSKKVLTK